MEKVFEGMGVIIAWVFFLMGFFIGSQWLWGCAIGAMISGLGMAFDT